MRIDRGHQLESNIRDRFSPLLLPGSTLRRADLPFFSPCDSVSSPSSDRRDQTSRSRSAVFIPCTRSRVNDFPTSRSFFWTRFCDRRDEIPCLHPLALPSRRPSKIRSFFLTTSVRRRAGENRVAIATVERVGALRPEIQAEWATAGSFGRSPAVRGSLVPGVGIEPTWGSRPEGF